MKVWKTILNYAVRWLLPLALTILLLTYMFRKVNFGEMWQIVTHGVDYWWILAAMGISVFSHIFRALRWRIQLRSLGITADGDSGVDIRHLRAEFDISPSRRDMALHIYRGP